MKVRVSYTISFSKEDLKALAAHRGEEIARDDLRQLLQDLGEMGVEEQISDGYTKLRVRAAGT